MLQIIIPKPCYQKWDDMTPNEEGRHCAFCAKTVVDFTTMSDDAVQSYLLNRKEEKVCGRFLNTQLQHNTIHLPQNIFDEPLPVWKHFLAACLLAFGMMLFSCNTTTKGEPLQHAKPTVSNTNTGVILTGKLEAIPPPPVSTPSKSKVQYVYSTCTIGDINIEPLPPVIPEEVVNEAIPDTVQQTFSDTLNKK